MSMLLANRMAAKCPCCWDSQGQGCGSALCMPFTYVSVTCPLMNFDGFLCRNAEKPAWVEPTYPPQCKQGWDTAGDEPCIYGSGPIANDDCGCIGYWAQYCTDDENGNRGRAWVVQFWCYDGGTGTAATSSVKVLDWECQCVGARFAYDLTIGGCCCECEPPVECCSDDATLTLTIDSSALDGCVEDPQLVTLTKVDGECAWEGTSDTPCTGSGTVCWRFELTGESDPDCDGTLSIYCSGSCDGVADASWSNGWHPAALYPPTKWVDIDAHLNSAACFDFGFTCTLTIT